MASEPSPPTSFSARRRWGIFFSVLISIVAMFALVIMLNYLGTRYYMRFSWSKETGVQLAPQTLSLLKSITNQVNVVIYYDKTDKLYDSVKGLLDEYHLKNPKISVQTVDYLVDAVLAQQIKATNKLGSAQEKNLVIFNCEGRRKIVPETLLADYTYKSVPNEKQPEWEQQLKAFEGEKQFSSALLNVINPRSFKACFLEGHAEHSLDSSSEDGYQKFGQVLEANNVQSSTLNLVGTNPIPADCNLLVIAGPRNAIPREELDKIRQYLDQGGRMFVLFNADTRYKPTGLEGVLTNWNIEVGMNRVSDPPNTLASGGALAVSVFNPNQPLIAPLIGSRLAMAAPRSISTLNVNRQGPEAPKVEELAFTGVDALLGEGTLAIPTKGHVPLIAAVKKNSLKGVFSERGTTAIVIAGDSVFLSNQGIDIAENQEFARLAINWLLEQTELLPGLGPRPVKEYKLAMTDAQMTRVTWLFLGAMPGAVLFFGALVWLRRRH